MDAGLTEVGFMLAVTRLQKREFIRLTEERVFDEEVYPAIVLEDASWAWMDDHAELFVLQRKKRSPKLENIEPLDVDIDDDIPF